MKLCESCDVTDAVLFHSHEKCFRNPYGLDCSCHHVAQPIR